MSTIPDAIIDRKPEWKAIADAARRQVRTPAHMVQAEKPVASVATADWQAWVDAMSALPGIFAYFEPMPNWLNDATKWRLARAVKRFQHRWAYTAVREWMTTVPQLVEPITVTITRYGLKMLDEPDGLAASLKHFIDGAAAAIGIDDGKTDRIRFVPRQFPQKFYGIRIEIESRRTPLVLPSGEMA